MRLSLCPSAASIILHILSASALSLPAAASPLLTAALWSTLAPLDRYFTPLISEANLCNLNLVYTRVGLAIPASSVPSPDPPQDFLSHHWSLRRPRPWRCDLYTSPPSPSPQPLWPALRATRPFIWRLPSPYQLLPSSNQYPPVTPTGNISSPTYMWTFITSPSVSTWYPYCRPIWKDVTALSILDRIFLISDSLLYRLYCTSRRSNIVPYSSEEVSPSLILILYISSLLSLKYTRYFVKYLTSPRYLS